MRRSGEGKLSCGLLIAVVIGLLFFGVAYKNSDGPATFTVKSKERVAGGDSSHYLIWTHEGEVFQVDDTIWFGRWDSSDLYGQLEVDQKYSGTVAGWRVPILSWYRNILEVEED